MKYFLLSNKVKKYLRFKYGISIFEKPPKSIKLLKQVYDLFQCKYLITIGDYVTTNVVKFWKIPEISIIDFKQLRKNYEFEYLHNFNYVIQVFNEASTLNFECFEILKQCFQFIEKFNVKVVIIVIGEEDLLAIPAILLSPEKTLIVYGNYYENCLQVIPVCKDYKLCTLKLLSFFKSWINHIQFLYVQLQLMVN